MKHKYLSLIALAGAMFMSTNLQAWDDPVPPTAPAPPATYTGDWATPESGGQYYIYNVGAGLFLGGGQTWGTRGIVLCDSVVTLDQSPVQINNVSGNTTANFVFPFEITQDPLMEEEWTFVVLNNSKNTSGAKYFVGEDGAQTWIDGDESRNTSFGAWTITPYMDGYMIQNVNASTLLYTDDNGDVTRAFGVDGNNIQRGWAATWTDLWIELPEGNTTLPWLTWKFVSAENAESVKAYNKEYKEKMNSEEYLAKLDAYEEAKKGYAAKTNLKVALEEAEEAGINTDVAGAVYTDPNATVEQVNAAITDLKYAIYSAQFKELFQGATDEEPLEVTEYCLVNADFSDGNIEGWDCTFQSGVNATNVGYSNWQPTMSDGRPGYLNDGKTLTSTGSSYNDDNELSYISNFIEAWKDNNDPWVIGDAQLQQTIFGLPTGAYKLTCDVIATHQHGKYQNPVTGVKLFIATDNGQEVFQEVATRDGIPEHFSVTFTCPEGVKALTFGLKTESTTANWIAADNFRIYYFGETEMSLAQIKLVEAIKAAGSSVEKIESGIYMAYQGDITAFETALKEAESIAATQTDDETYADAQAKLEAAQAAYEASVTEYEKLGTFIGADGSASKLDEYMETAGQLGDLYDELEPWESELKNGYYDGAITNERIEELMGSFLNKIREYIKKGNINPGDDITILLDNPDFSEGSTSDPTGWTINNGSLTELASATGNIETWHKTFDISQTITDMPAGIYDITVQGFVRHDNGSVTDQTYFYAGDTKTCLMTLEDQWSFEPIYTSDGPNPYIHDGNYDATMTTVEGETAYKCNGMGGAYYWFQTEIPADLYPTFKYKAPSDQNWDGDNYYTNHIKVVLSQPGDFTIGLGTTAGEDWIIWDNFKIKYLGDDMNIYIQMINEAFAKLQETHDGDEAFVTKKAEDDFNAVAKKVEDAANLQTGKEALALIDEINQISSYISAGSKAGSNLETTYYLYAEYLMPTVESSDATFPALLSQIESSFANPAEIADNEAIDALVAELKKGWVKYVMADHIADASAENPQDVSAAIFNPDYTDYDMNTEQQTNSEGWTNEGSNGSTIYNSIYYAEIEFYNTNFNHYQTIQGLEPGWYIVANDAFYRAGDVNAMTTAYNDSVPALNSYMYAVVAGDTVATKYVHGMFDGAQIEPTYSDGEVTVDLTQEEGLNGTYYVPNLMGSAYEFLNIEDEEGNKFFTNQIVVEVKEDGVLTIGMRKTELIANDWTVITNWSLSYIGKEAPVAVESLEAKQSVKAAQFFGIDGRQQSRIQRGVNIVRMADGSVRKVMVK